MKPDYVVLRPNVLVVAQEGAFNDWSAYIGKVSSEDYQKECIVVALLGSKIPEERARALFPSYRDLRYRT